MDSAEYSAQYRWTEVQRKILDISVNMARISQWIEDGSYQQKKKLVKIFMDQNEEFLNWLATQNISEDFKPTLERFTKEFNKIKNQKIIKKNRLEWAEKALTWANILQHRAKLA